MIDFGFVIEFGLLCAGDGGRQVRVGRPRVALLRTIASDMGVCLKKVQLGVFFNGCWTSGLCLHGNGNRVVAVERCWVGHQDVIVGLGS